MSLREIYIVKKESFVTRKVDNEMVLVPLVNSVADMTKVLTLNDTGISILEAMNGQNTVEEIISQLLETYNVQRERLQEDVERFIENAILKGIIEPQS
ncbi:PqqD family protein [Geofilum sp. OHC36d9]|uniref:PqqD family protein n=1 Tax=Geofilum sp. OHC36d9 TaxID=3458413 RepID=UPI0040348C84